MSKNLATLIRDAAHQLDNKLAKEAAMIDRKLIHGIVVSAGKMDKTFKIQMPGLRWEPRVKKHYKDPHFKLVHDPANSVRTGDVVAVTASWRYSKDVNHCVSHIVSPNGAPISARPPIPTYEERFAARAAAMHAKLARRTFYRQAVDAVNAAKAHQAQAVGLLRRAGLPPAPKLTDAEIAEACEAVEAAARR